MMKYGVIGDGFVASIFKGLPDFEVVHRDEWLPIRWDGLINCAGLSSRSMCEEAPFLDVLAANVFLPIRIREAIDQMERPVPFIQLSSCAVYKHPTPHDTPLKETDPIYPLHSYSASKILMEQALSRSNTYIFRIPRVITDNGHPGDFEHHAGNWKYVEGRFIVIVRGNALLKAVEAVMRGVYSMSEGTYSSAPPGTYNISSEVVYLPDLAKAYGVKNLDIVPADSMEGFGPWPVLDSGKAEQYGLI